jgi:hypothetical protein
MKKILAVFVITILYALPLSVLAQRKSAPQTKTGKYEATVIYDAVNEFNQNNTEGTNYKSYNAHYTTKMHIQYQVSERVNKIIRHDGTTSIVEPLEPQAIGKFSYTHTGEEHHVTNDGFDLHYDSKEDAAYSGVISKDGSVSAEFPDTGDAMLNAQASAGGIGNGFFKRTINREEYVQIPGTSVSQSRKQYAKPEIDTDCQDGANTGPLVMTGNLDATQPPETACAVELAASSAGFNVFTKVMTLDEMQQDEGTWAAAKSTGSFASGKYEVTLAQTLKPKTWNTEIQKGTNTFSETLSFSVTLTLAGATAEISSPGSALDSNLLAEVFTTEDRMRVTQFADPAQDKC